MCSKLSAVKKCTFLLLISAILFFAACSDGGSGLTRTQQPDTPQTSPEDDIDISQPGENRGDLGGIGYEFIQPEDETITLSGAQTLSWAEGKDFTIFVEEVFDSYQWYVDGSVIGANNNSITLFAGNFSIGTHTVTLKVAKNGIPYTKTIYFTIS